MENEELTWQQKAKSLNIKFIGRKKEDVLKDIENAKANGMKATEKEVVTNNNKKLAEAKNNREFLKKRLTEEVSIIKNKLIYRTRWNNMKDVEKEDFLKKTLRTYPFGWEFKENRIRVFLLENKKTYITSDEL